MRRWPKRPNPPSTATCSPFTPSALFERLSLARLRKNHLKPIFDAIGEEDFEGAARLCVQRFEAREPYWLYAARIGSELLLRLGRHDEARTLFEAVIDARALPWAKLGVARSQIEAGQAPRAVTTLQGIISDDASFADAYDVPGARRSRWASSKRRSAPTAPRRSSRPIPSCGCRSWA